VERTRRLIQLATANLLAVCDLHHFERPPILDEPFQVQTPGMWMFSNEMTRLFDLGSMQFEQATQLPDARQICRWIATTPWLVNDSVRGADVLESFDRIAAKRGVTEIFLALRIWQTRTGEYPHALGELVGVDLDTLPIDPFSGHSFGYVPSSGQVLKHAGPNDSPLEIQVGSRLLYSVGPDGVDQDATMECEYGRGHGDWIFLLP
jgi:hypothetical protein